MVGKNENQYQAKGSLRIIFLVVFLVIFFLLIVSRLFILQVRSGDFYRLIAEKQHISNETIPARRGAIFLSEKDDIFPVAVEQDLPTVYAVPKEIKEGGFYQLVEQLGNILNLDKSELEKKLKPRPDGYEVIKKKISSQEEKDVLALKASGIYLSNENWRFYPSGKLAAQTIGFMGYKDNEIRGIYGVESFFDEKLKGISGYVTKESDAAGRWISVGDRQLVPPRDGTSIVLSLDHIIQFKAEIILKNAVKKHKAQGGKIIIMDPYDGKILAMAQEPTFNLNEYSKVEDSNVFRNFLISDSYECGSVFKIITMAAGIDSGKVTPETIYNDTGSVVEAGYEIRNSDNKANGQQTMTQVIEKSLNTGVIFVTKEIGKERFLEYIRDFGFGEKSGIDLPSETTGDISNLKTGRNIEYYTASFGQGITVTPIQLVTAYAAIANGGDLLKPQIVDRFLLPDKSEEKVQREVRRKVISQNSANQLALMLESNVVNGHGKQAAVPGYRVAGKTGTAQIPDRENGGYIEGANVGSFVGFAPVENPRFVMAVIIDNPKNVEWAESSAAPVFGEMSKFLFDYFGIASDSSFTDKDLEKFNQTHQYFIYKEEEAEKKQSEEKETEAVTE